MDTPGFPILHYLPESVQTHALWVSDAIYLSHPLMPLSSCPQFFPASGSFPLVSFAHQVAKVLKLQLQHQSVQWYSGFISYRMDWFDLLSSRDSRVSPMPQFKSISSVLSLLMVQFSHPYMTIGKAGEAKCCLCFLICCVCLHNFPSQEQAPFNFMVAPLSTVILEPMKKKSVTVSSFPPSICHEMMGPDAMILVFWMLSLNLTVT